MWGPEINRWGLIGTTPRLSWVHDAPRSVALAEPFALAVFVLTYAVVSVGRLRTVRIDRAAASLFGGILMVAVVGLLAESRAVDTLLSAVNLDVLLLLLGMLILVAGLDAAGFFEWTAVRLVLAAKDARHLLLLTIGACALLSAIALNDAVVLLFTPMIVRACRLLRLAPGPYVIAVALAANVGSAATPMGNPQNAFIAIEAPVPFATFAARLVPISHWPRSSSRPCRVHSSFVGGSNREETLSAHSGETTWKRKSTRRDGTSRGTPRSSASASSCSSVRSPRSSRLP